MAPEYRGTIALDVRDSKPDWAPYLPPRAPAGAPNVLFLAWDDLGLRHDGRLWWSGRDAEHAPHRRHGGPVLELPHDRVVFADRASLLTGRNATSNGMATIAEFSSGFPGISTRIPFENGFISEVLAERGYNTYCVGKWHLAPGEECNLAAFKGRWPLGRGFERFYGFLGGESNQWYPDLVQDNCQIDAPGTPEDGYHLSKDLADQAIGMIQAAKVIDPDKPFFMYLAPGAGTLRIRCSRNGPTSTRGGSTRATKPSGLASSSSRRSSDSSPKTLSCPRSTRTANRRAQVRMVSRGRPSTRCVLGAH